MPVFTPPHVIVFAELEKFKGLLEQQKEDLVRTFKEELDKRQVGGDSFLANGILDQISAVQDKMMDVLEQPRERAMEQQQTIYDGFLMVQDRLSNEEEEH